MRPVGGQAGGVRSRSRSQSRAAAAAPVGAGEWFTLVVDALATYRLVRLATADVISESVRMAVVRGVGTDVPGAPGEVTAQEAVEDMDVPPKLATLVTCRWCAGVWIGAGVTAARHLAPRAWDVAARGLALSSVAVLLARLEEADAPTSEAVRNDGQS